MIFMISKIFSIDGKVRGYPTTKYMVKDVEKLVIQLTKCSPTDKRYIALREYCASKNRQIERSETIIHNMNAVKEYLISLSQKFELYDLMIEIINKDIDSQIEDMLEKDPNIVNVGTELLLFVDKKANAKHVLNQMIMQKYNNNELLTYVNSNYEFKKYYDTCVNYMINKNIQIYDDDQQQFFIKLDKALSSLKRAKHVNNLITTQFGEEYIDKFSQNYYYTQYITASSSDSHLQWCLSQLTDEIQTQICIDKMNALISEYSPELQQKVHNSTYYNKVIKGKMTVDDAIIKINKIIDKHSAEEMRKNKIGILTNKYIGQAYNDITHNCNTYKKYISGQLDKLKIDKIAERIIDEVNDVIERKSRINALTFALITNNISFIKNITTNDICLKFIDGKDELDETMNEINEEIKRRENRHDQIIDSLDQKYRDMLGTIIKYTHRYHNYIDTGSDLSSAINSMKYEISKYEQMLDADKWKINLENIIQNFRKSNAIEIILSNYSGNDKSYFHDRAQKLNMTYIKINKMNIKLIK